MSKDIRRLDRVPQTGTSEVRNVVRVAVGVAAVVAQVALAF